MMDAKNNINWELITGKLYNELDDTDKKTFEKWSQDKKTDSVFNKAEKIYEGLDKVGILQKVNKAKSWNGISTQIRKLKVRQLSVLVIRYAAIVVFAFLIGKFIGMDWFSDEDNQYAEIEVMDGQMGHLFLFDGTEVWLNSGSYFKYPNQFNKKERNVFLDGEAYFKVKSNKKLPFIVQTDKMQIEVLGTSFNVLAYKNENKESVVLEEGIVQINKANGEKILKLSPGQRAIKSANSLQLQVENVKTSNFTAWKDGVIAFDAEELGEIAQKLERWYNVNIRFENEKLKKYQITGTILRNKPIDQVMQAISLLAPIRYKHQNKLSEKDIITIEKR